jgi:hypothetical protein
MKCRIVCSDLEVSFTEDDGSAPTKSTFDSLAPFLASAMGSIVGSGIFGDAKIERNETPPAAPAAPTSETEH